MSENVEIREAYRVLQLSHGVAVAHERHGLPDRIVRIILRDLWRRVEELESGPFVGSKPPYPITEAYLNDAHQMDIDECIVEAMKDQ